LTQWSLIYRLAVNTVTGSVTFTLTTPGTGTGAAPPASTDGPAAAADTAPALPGDAGGMPVWPWILGVLVLIGGGVFTALKLGR
jgi:copper resistance protein C